MVFDVTVPKLGLTMTRAVVTQWFKAPGDPVREGEKLFSFESDKAQSTVTSEWTGVLTQIFVGAGEEADVFSVVARIARGEGAAEAARSAGSQRVTASPRARRLAAEHGVDLNEIILAGGGRIEQRDVEAALAARAQARAEESERPPEAPVRSTLLVKMDTMPLDALCQTLIERADAGARERLIGRAARAAAEGLEGLAKLNDVDGGKLGLGLYVSGAVRLPALVVGAGYFVLMFDERVLSPGDAAAFAARFKDLAEMPALFLART